MDFSVVERWKEQARAIAVSVTEVASVPDALVCCLEICAAAPPHKNLMPENSRDDQQKILAAPGLPARQLELLRKECARRGLRLVERNLRDHPGGMEVGVAWARAGLANTGTCIVQSTNEDVRLATMLPETSIILLHSADIIPDLEDSAPLLRELFSGDPAYIAFISGPSRTADIERVLTLGVHGPLWMHVLLVNDHAPFETPVTSPQKDRQSYRTRPNGEKNEGSVQ